MTHTETQAMCERISADHAQSAISRLTAGAFRRDGEHLEEGKRPRFSIPARPDEDDDLVAMAYVQQVEALLTRQQEEIEALTEALKEIDAPMVYAQRRADEADAVLNGVAYGICNSVPYLQNIARAALQAKP